MRLYNPCHLAVPIVERNRYCYMALAFLGSPRWKEINMAA